MNDIVSVVVSGPGKPVLLDAPVPAVVKVKNVSAQPVKLTLPFPNPNDLRFAPTPDGKTEGMVVAKPVEHQRSVRSVAVELAPGQEHAVTYCLNRYLRLARPGRAEIEWKLALSVTVAPGTPKAVDKNETIEGKIQVTVAAGTEKELRQELEGYSQKLGSDDRKTRVEAAEALAFLDTPVAVDYIARMLPVEGLAPIGIRALGRLPSPTSSRLIIGMLKHKESGVVAAALGEIDARKIDVPRDDVRALLASDNASVRWTTLDWLSRHPDPSDLQKVTPLIADANGPVAELARRYRDTLKKP